MKKYNNMDSFYNKIDNLFKEHLDFEIPELVIKAKKKENLKLLEENKQIVFDLSKKTGQNNWGKDKALGDKGETLILNWFNIRGHKILESRHNGSGLDLKTYFQNKEQKFEVKTDLSYKKTGNLAFEFERKIYKNGEYIDEVTPSGISVSLAHFIIYMVPADNKLLFFRTEKLINQMNAWMEENPKSIRWGGDSNATHMVVRSLELIKNNKEAFEIMPAC